MILSSQPRRAFYSSARYCQAVISNTFQSFLCNFNHLRFDQLRVSRQREANSTAFQLAVNCLFSPLPITATEASSSLTNLANSLITKGLIVAFHEKLQNKAKQVI
ncbi:hypothetical protein [Pseudomonas sp. AH2]|uniref:hypothetical protein n=1 Tax=Pseudomonas sp. AH2 TaxID=181555 RepID=UPI002AC9CDA5|nr:hypothetical protein [Pseudomonas sp. AH2]WPX28101.1 hypothetical protein RHM64_00005 [Pseudomonas sp. AH2]